MKTSKLILGLLMLCLTSASYAQLSEKVSKPAKKEAKRLKKEGWKVFTGALPLEYQLDHAYQIQNNKLQEYVIGNAQSVGQFIDAAKLQASEMAKADLVGNISVEITRLVSATVDQSQTARDQAASAIQVVEKSKSLVVQKIGTPIPLVEMYRELKNGNVEVLIRIAYDKKMGETTAKDVIRPELKKLGIDLVQ